LPKILVLNGPNLNLLGTREPTIYGRDTLGDIERACRGRAVTLGLDLEFRQTNHEGALIDWIQAARLTASGIVINAGGLSHGSISLMDALAAIDLPVIEVHLTNIHRREEFRHHSLVSRVARGVIVGLGGHGYELALEAMARLLAAPE
jgi:3-dehydroquinate dehydratase-2